MDIIEKIELNKQMITDISELVNMSWSHTRSTDEIIEDIVEAITKRDQALQLHKTQVSGSVLKETYTKSKISERIFLETTEEIKNKAREYGNSLVNEWIPFDEKYPDIYKSIFVGQWDIVQKRMLKQKAMLTTNGLELILDIGNLEIEITKPTHWKLDRY